MAHVGHLQPRAVDPPLALKRLDLELKALASPEVHVLLSAESEVPPDSRPLSGPLLEPELSGPTKAPACVPTTSDLRFSQKKVPDPLGRRSVPLRLPQQLPWYSPPRPVLTEDAMMYFPLA